MFGRVLHRKVEFMGAELCHVVPCCANVFGDPGSKFALAQLLECW